MSNKSSTMFKPKKFATQSSTKHEDDPLTTPNDLLKAQDYFIHQQMFNKRPFFSTNFAEFSLPPDTLFAQFFFSEFYFPDDCNYPVPCSQIFSHISPILINIDYLTLLWMNTLVLSLWNEKLTKLNHLAPCFKDLIRNENIAYFRYDLSFDDDLTKMINTTTEAHNSKIGLFLKSLNRTALNKNASKGNPNSFIYLFIKYTVNFD